MLTVGEKIRLSRKAAGLTQKELGKKMGVSASMIGQYETNLRVPKYETLQRISNALSVNITELVDFNEISPTFNRMVSLIPDITSIFDRPPNAEGNIILSDSDKNKMKDLAFTIDSLRKEMETTEFMSEDLRVLYVELFDKLNFYGKCAAIQYVRSLSDNPAFQGKRKE